MLNLPKYEIFQLKVNTYYHFNDLFIVDLQIQLMTIQYNFVTPT